MTRSSKGGAHRVDRRSGPTVRNWGDPTSSFEGEPLQANSLVECGWGRLLFGHTFESPERLVEELLRETPGRRDIAFYLRDPHVVLSIAPQSLFLDPSHTYRLWLSDYRPGRRPSGGFVITPVRTRDDMDQLNRIYAARDMVTVAPDFLESHRGSRAISYLVARDEEDDSVIGVVMGVDHTKAFADPENGSSLWSLAVDPQTSRPGVGEGLTRRLAERFLGRGRSFMDLSVVHDNHEAIALYEKLGFRRIPVFAVKTRNAINQALYTVAAIEEGLNLYARVIVEEARRRGIAVEVLDAKAGFFRLSLGSQSIVCRESLSELTSAVAMSLCDDKAVTRRVFERAGLAVPAQREARGGEQDHAFLREHRRVVVKPARGEQGKGITVDCRTPDELDKAIALAQRFCDTVLLEQFVEGDDLRVIVIGGEVVAAAVRRPAQVTGTGKHTIAQLIESQSRRREAATAGESRIPLDEETRRAVAAEGFSLDDTLPAGRTLTVRRTANLHTGGTIHDVTPRLNPLLAEVSIAAAKALEMPVVGLDLLVPRVEGTEYVLIEANERPGLANHEPQPTVERFIDLLFPQTAGGISAAAPPRTEAV